MSVVAYSSPIKGTSSCLPFYQQSIAHYIFAVLSKSSIVKAHKAIVPAIPSPSSASATGVAALMTPAGPLASLPPAPRPAPCAAPASAASITGQKRKDRSSGSSSSDDESSTLSLLLAEQRHAREDMCALRADMRALTDSVGALRDVLAAFFGVGVPPAKSVHMDGQLSPQHASQQQPEHMREPCGAGEDELEFRAVD